MTRTHLWASLLLLSTTLLTPALRAQESTLPKRELPSGTEQITESSIAATVSFLASDELAGRGTGSSEFDIAAAYVASRFRSVGMQSGGDNGTYYHITEFPLKYPPESATLSLGEETHLLFGILGASTEHVSYSGEWKTINPDKPDDWGTLSTFVVAEWETTAKAQRAHSQLARLAQKLEAAGAKGLILKASADSEWHQQAINWQSRPRLEPRNDINIPILVVSLQLDLTPKIRVDVPPVRIATRPMRNVIGVIPGSDPELSKQGILFSAHLDHLGSIEGEGDRIFNGADDDASGVTAVLTLADAYAKSAIRPRRTLLFMTFWGEEVGLLGSQAYVERPSWPLKNIAANINIEMIGRPEDGARNKTWVTGWNESDLGPLMRRAAEEWGYEIFEHPQFSPMLYRSSDNWSFVQKGVVAHSFSAGSLHGDYHQVNDEWERLELEHMTQVIRALYVGSLPLANGEITPKRTK